MDVEEIIVCFGIGPMCCFGIMMVLLMFGCVIPMEVIIGAPAVSVLAMTGLYMCSNADRGLETKRKYIAASRRSVKHLDPSIRDSLSPQHVVLRERLDMALQNGEAVLTDAQRMDLGDAIFSVMMEDLTIAADLIDLIIARGATTPDAVRSLADEVRQAPKALWEGAL